MQINAIHLGDCLEGLKKMESGTVHCIVTSPPYYGLRSYLPDVVKLREDAPEWVKEEISRLGIKAINNPVTP